MATRYFTLEQANAELPRLTAQLASLMQISAQLRLTTQSEHVVPPGLPWLADAVASAEVADPARNSELSDSLYEALSEGVQELESGGIQVKDLPTGLVDFPSYLDGEDEVLLCWRLGEPEVAHYHSPKSGFAGRRPVAGRRFTDRPARAVRSPGTPPAQG